MTGVTPVDGPAGLDGCPIDGAPASVDGAPGAVDAGTGVAEPSPRTIAEAVRTAVTLPASEGARLLVELALAGGPWQSAALARRPPDGRWTTWVGTGPLGQLCDQLQWQLGEGPALDALTTDLVFAPDLTADRRWPAWRTAAVPLGGRAAVAVRLQTGRTLGSLSLYADRPVVADGAAVEHLRTMAAHVSALIDAVDRLAHLEQGMRSRGAIGQAIGLLSERYGISADQAFATLRRISQSENVKIAQLATVLAETGELPPLHQRGG